MALVDLHLHTTASDGRLSPTELVHLAASQNVQIMAVTDHDSTDGLREAAAAAGSLDRMEIIPGIELGTDIPGTEVHMLAYFIQHNRRDLQEELKRLRAGRQDRARGMVEKLTELGFPMDWERVQQIAGEGAVGRPHVAQAMVERGYVQETKEAFDKYIGRSCPAYVEREKMTPPESIKLIKSWGGVPVLAHPIYIPNLESVLGEMVDAGLVGMEVYYAKCTPEQIDHIARLAEEYSLLPCGGSDYHGTDAKDEPLPGAMGPSLEVVEQLRQLASAGN